MKYKIGLVMLLGVLGGSLLAISFVNPYNGEISLSEFVLQLSGSRGEFPLGLSMSELVSLITRMIPCYIFEVYFGTILYRHFCTASIYVFSRYPKRIRWYLQETLVVAATSCLFQIMILAAAFLFTIIRFKMQVDWIGIILLIYHFLIHSALLYSMTMLVNLLAISIGSSASFMAVIGMQALCITLLGGIGTFHQYIEKGVSEILLLLNPISHLVLGWHSSKNGAINQRINSPYSLLDIDQSLQLIAAFAVIITLLGAFYIKKQDLIIADSEKGAI